MSVGLGSTPKQWRRVELPKHKSPLEFTVSPLPTFHAKTVANKGRVDIFYFSKKMGRDVTGLRTDKKSSVVSVKSNSTINGAVHVSPKALPETDVSKDYEAEGHTVKGTLPDEHNKKQEVLGVKSTNHEPVEKIMRAEAHKSDDKKLSSPLKPASGSSVHGTTDANSFEPLKPGEEANKQTLRTNDAEINYSGVKSSQQFNDLHSPKTTKKSQAMVWDWVQPNSPAMSTKQLQLNDKKYYDEEDNWSMASSTATSVRTNKSRITVPVAPRFSCTNRLERRKEFYTKLEEKHRALEKEKLEYEARTKEEEQKVIKQMRKSMVVKANPVPSFYREGPPPKVELKKLPVTRAKSPNLTRRKSCGDAVKTSPGDIKGIRARHSVGVYKEAKSSPITPKGKDRIGVRKSNERSKVNDHPKETTPQNPHVKEQDINAVESC
ncbi:hypothetical protein BUALT_Bualt01G0146500 [Buddleja alternifolia]|uniref:TPX2 C-terminal domain-containing protein n=1 Tax=Buddleja alternifolia TaxID=168488 RepID=A0AAV6YE53_9LAMI|nr:hypothetical protein BUALT_Bualt01G0146500 [Buddleja alternifolia]